MTRSVPLLLGLTLLACSDGAGDGDGSSSACRAVDVSFPDFVPTDAKDGESVTMTFTLEEGKPTTACLAEVELDCGGQKTSYIVGGTSAGELKANLILHCDQATGPVECSYTYQYPRGGPNQSGLGSGPKCTP